MSRSHKKTPVFSIYYEDSDKQDKRRANRNLRRLTKAKVKKLEDAEIEEEASIPEIREVSNRRKFSKGSMYFFDDCEMIRRANGNPERAEQIADFYEKSMRK